MVACAFTTAARPVRSNPFLRERTAGNYTSHLRSKKSRSLPNAIGDGPNQRLRRDHFLFTVCESVLRMYCLPFSLAMVSSLVLGPMAMLVIKLS